MYECTWNEQHFVLHWKAIKAIYFFFTSLSRCNSIILIYHPTESEREREKKVHAFSSYVHFYRVPLAHFLDLSLSLSLCVCAILCMCSYFSFSLCTDEIFHKWNKKKLCRFFYENSMRFCDDAQYESAAILYRSHAFCLPFRIAA